MTLPKWISYTVIPALMPIVLRVLIMMMASNKVNAPLVLPSDVIMFGMVLCITNISTLESIRISSEDWKSTSIGISLFGIGLFAALFAATCTADVDKHIFDEGALLMCSSLLSISSLLLSFALWHRISSVFRVVEG